MYQLLKFIFINTKLASFLIFWVKGAITYTHCSGISHRVDTLIIKKFLKYYEH